MIIRERTTWIYVICICINVQACLSHFETKEIILEFVNDKPMKRVHWWHYIVNQCDMHKFSLFAKNAKRRNYIWYCLRLAKNNWRKLKKKVCTFTPCFQIFWHATPTLKKTGYFVQNARQKCSYLIQQIKIFEFGCVSNGLCVILHRFNLVCLQRYSNCHCDPISHTKKNEMK